MILRMINTVLLLYGLMAIIAVTITAIAGDINPDSNHVAYWIFGVGIAAVLWVGIFGICNTGAKQDGT